MLQKFTEYLLEKCKSSHAQYYLFANGFFDAFFPWLPPIEVLLTPICTAQPKKWAYMALVGLVGTVLGAVSIYCLSRFFTHQIAEILTSFPSLGYDETVVKKQFSQWGFYAVFILSALPLPVLFTSFVSGSQEINLFVFILAISMARGIRFFTVAYLIYKFNDQISLIVKKYFIHIVVALVFLFIIFIIFLRVVT